MTTVGLISCSSAKLAHPAPARELYCSPLFRLSLSHAEGACSVVYVLSALHGLVELDTVIAPYNRRIGGKAEREAWARRIASSLIAKHGRDIAYLVLAGADYAAPIATALRTHDGHRDGAWRGVAPSLIHTPLSGMAMGVRLRWLSQQNSRTD